MQRRFWGRLIAAHLGAPLLSACSSPPAPQPPSGAPAATTAPVASASPEVDPTAGPAGLGAWTPLTAAQAEVVHTPRVVRAAASDKGVFVLARSRVGERGCAWNGAADETCTGFFFAPWKEAGGSPARFPVGAVGPWTPVKVSRDWAWIWSGRQGAYALGEQDKKQIVAILDGQTERIFQVEGKTRIEQIVETSKGPLALWSVGGLASAPLTLQGGKATLGKATKYRISVVSTAQQARDTLKGKGAPAVEWAAIPNMNDAGGLDTAFLLTWSEAVPPEKKTERVSAAERRILSKRSIMCGFSPSRGVDDPSVVKRIMVQRVRSDGGAEGPPREIARSEAGKEAPLLRLETRPKARERLVGEGERVELPSGLMSAPEQEVVAAGYDPARQEGVVVLSQAGELVAQVIDPLGKASGALVKLGASRPVERRAVFAHGSWIVPASRGKSLVVLTGPRAGSEITSSVREEALRSWSLVGAQVVVTAEATTVVGAAEADPGSIGSEGALLRAELKKDGTTMEYRGVPDGMEPPAAALGLEDGSIAAFVRVMPEADDPPAVRPTSWREVLPKKEDAKAVSESLDGPSVLVEVFKDLVLVHRAEDEKPLEGVWLRSGKSFAFEGSEKREVTEFSLFTGGTFALPPTPGPAVAVGAPAQAPRGCVDELAVGPRTRLFFCYKPVGSRGWAHTAGVQVLRFLAARRAGAILASVYRIAASDPPEEPLEVPIDVRLSWLVIVLLALVSVALVAGLGLTRWQLSQALAAAPGKAAAPARPGQGGPGQPAR